MNVPAERTAAEDTAAGASGELETRESVEEAKADLLEVGEGTVKNDTGEYRMTIRRKNDGHYLAAVDFNGKRSQARTFGTAAEAAKWVRSLNSGLSRNESSERKKDCRSEFRQSFSYLNKPASIMARSPYITESSPSAAVLISTVERIAGMQKRSTCANTFSRNRSPIASMTPPP